MKLQDQVCNYQQARRLKELGVAQEAYWSWAHVVERMHESFNGEVREWEPEYAEEPTLVETSMAQWEGLPFAAAYTVAELGQMLREASELRWELHYMAGAWFIRIGLLKPEILEGVKHEAHARAAFLIKLLEGQLLTLEETNKRL